MVQVSNKIPEISVKQQMSIVMHQFRNIVSFKSAQFSTLNGDTINLLDGSKYYYKVVNPRDNSIPELQNLTSVNMMRQEKRNLTAITWAHAVNSQKHLTEALNSTIDMIEADIVLGKKNNEGPTIPVMAHPPDNTSDITLAEFLTQIMAYNEQHVNKTKGVKLDFKTIEVFEGSMDTLTELIPKMFYPIWFNADIIPGPVNQTEAVPVDPDRFFAGSARFENVVLSIGWTTTWTNKTEGNYTTEQMNNMFKALKRNNVTETERVITFPVRAGIGANSQAQLHDLVSSVNRTNEASITIWGSGSDYVDVDKLRQLIFSFGVDRVYLDVPEDLHRKLNLGNGKAGRIPSFVNFVVVSVGMYLASLWVERALY